MSKHTISYNTKLVRVPLNGTTTYTGTAGTTSLTSEGVDTLGYEGIRWIIGFGAIVSGAVTSIKVQQSSDDGSTDTYDDLAGTSQAVADTNDNGVFVSDIYHPQKRYQDVVISRATQNSTVDFILAELYLPLQAAVTQDATVIGQEVFNSPAEGTA